MAIALVLWVFDKKLRRLEVKQKTIALLLTGAPGGARVLASNGLFYGTTSEGGNAAAGCVGLFAAADGGMGLFRVAAKVAEVNG